MLLLTLMPTHIKWDEIFLNFFYWNNAPFVMTPDDHQTPTSISHEKWEVPWVFFHILIVQGIYLYNIKVIEPLTSALIFFLYVYKKRKNGKKKKMRNQILITRSSLANAQPLQKVSLKSIVYFEKYGFFNFWGQVGGGHEVCFATSISRKPLKIKKKYLAFLSFI